MKINAFFEFLSKTLSVFQMPGRWQMAHVRQSRRLVILWPGIWCSIWKSHNHRNVNPPDPLAFAASLPTQGFLPAGSLSISSLAQRAYTQPLDSTVSPLPQFWAWSFHQPQREHPERKNTVIIGSKPQWSSAKPCLSAFKQGLRGQADWNTNSSYRLRAYPVPGIVLNALYTWSHLTVTTTLGWVQLLSYFTNVETETDQRS